MRVRLSILTLVAALAAGVAPQAAAAPSGGGGSDAGGPPPSAALGSGIQAAVAAAAAELAEAAREAAAPAEAGSATAESASKAQGTGAVLGASAQSSPRPRLHKIAVVEGDVGLSDRPGGPATTTVGSQTEFGSKRVLGVAARRRGWLGVVPTGRNGRLAWVRRGHPGLRLRRTGYSLHADLSDRTLTLRKDGRRVKRLTVAIGRPGSETPTGRFAVTDKLSGSSYGPYYGCCILALSGIQPNTPPGWTGGNRLAIHGTDSPSTIGAAASAGCLRASDEDLRPLMDLVPLGTLVFIRA
jgi:L,D-transpeptidase catalytic domain